MLRTYGKQLSSAKRLARFRRALRMAGAEDAVTISREAKRRELVDRVTNEIMENLIVSGSQSPVVTEIMERLELEFQDRFVLEYPLEGDDVIVLRESESGPEELNQAEKRMVLKRLWEITRTKVDETML
jgi:hypothetical protein